MNKIMEPEIITDKAGEPLSVIIDYKEYIKILEELKRPLPVVKPKEQYPMGRLTLMESVRDILSGLVALAGREHIKEMNKPNPDQNRIAELVALRNEAHKVHRDLESYESDERMEEIIAKYGPILRAEKKKLL